VRPLVSLPLLLELAMPGRGDWPGHGHSARKLDASVCMRVCRRASMQGIGEAGKVGQQLRRGGVEHARGRYCEQATKLCSMVKPQARRARRLAGPYI
jgi:hypothetical protein